MYIQKTLQDPQKNQNLMKKYRCVRCSMRSYSSRVPAPNSQRALSSDTRTPTRHPQNAIFKFRRWIAHETTSKEENRCLSVARLFFTGFRRVTHTLDRSRSTANCIDPLLDFLQDLYTAQNQARKLVLDHAGFTASTRQYELQAVLHTDQGNIYPERYYTYSYLPVDHRVKYL